MKKTKFDHREAKQFLLTEQALRIMGEDLVYLDINVYRIMDVELLKKWWRRLNPEELIQRGIYDTRRFGQSSIEQLATALWVRLNEIHPKYCLRFQDLAA